MNGPTRGLAEVPLRPGTDEQSSRGACKRWRPRLDPLFTQGQRQGLPPNPA